MLGYRFPENSPLMKNIAGAKEIDIVYSGLEEILNNAARENWEFAEQHHLTLRDACLVNSLQSLASRFEESGMMI